jgi:hypothetical protein
MRGRASGFDATTRHAIKRNGLLDSAGGHRIYRVTHDRVLNKDLTLR